MCPSLSTGVFRMGHGAFLRRLAQRHARWYVVGAAIAIVALLGISILCRDFRYAVLALMILFIVIPMLAALLYINYALAPKRSFNTMPHRLTLTERVVRVEILGPARKEDVEEKIEDRRDEDREEENREEKKQEEKNKVELEPVGVLEIAYSELGSYRVGADYVIVPVSGKQGFIYLPAFAFEEPATMKRFLKEIYKNGK